MHVLQGEVAVVTGAGQGNGAAIALGLAQAGARVALADINGETVAKVRETIAEAGGEAIAAQLDVTDENGARAFRNTVHARFGPASILVNNAGVIRRTEIEGTNYESDWDATFAVNVTGPRNMVRAFLPDLKTTSGCVVNLASIMSLVAGPGLTAYAASKGAVAQFTKALAQDMAPHGVRVNAILPGVIETPMTEITRQTPEAIGRFMAHTPMRRVGQPEELVGPVVFLASKAASYVTGALLPVDGGYLTA
ncbi:SDR family NAD(P)-dependent oxidoreductase [Albibacillus kandeliae]|uniref:SDR family NAD(P)-dependent oxidoreductase n=1 Tax=Albibacillus kandeliae TaxID=2174228 RepID=UPI000D68C003|nr:glucose 1-dehydrogenase [Albibacillus kandeliae]